MDSQGIAPLNSRFSLSKNKMKALHRHDLTAILWSKNKDTVPLKRSIFVEHDILLHLPCRRTSKAADMLGFFDVKGAANEASPVRT